PGTRDSPDRAAPARHAGSGRQQTPPAAPGRPAAHGPTPAPAWPRHTRCAYPRPAPGVWAPLTTSEPLPPPAAALPAPPRCPTAQPLCTTRSDKDLRAVSTIIFSALRFIVPSIGILTSTCRR